MEQTVTVKSYYRLLQKMDFAALDTAIQQAPVVRRLGNAIHCINHYPADSVVCFVNT